MKPHSKPLNFSYQKNDAKIWVLNTDDIPLKKEVIKDQQIVHFGPQAVGGNHTHPRTEWFIGIGDLVLVWLDENNQKQELEMNPNGNLLLITIPPHLPHAVINRSANPAVLFEYADSKQYAVEKVIVI